MGVVYCCVPGCLSNTEADMGLSFFSFLLDPKRCSEWVKNCNRQDFRAKSLVDLHRGYRVCGKHFQPTVFAGMSQSRLKKFAVPTLFMSENFMMEVEATIPAIPVTSEALLESTSPDVIDISSTSKEVTSEDFSQQTPTSLSADSPRKHGLRLQIRSLKRKLEFHPEYSFIFFINNIYLKR